VNSAEKATGGLKVVQPAGRQALSPLQGGEGWLEEPG